MERPGKMRLGGGCLLAICVMGGVVWGTYNLQPSIGFLAGLGIGIVLAAFLWLIDLVRR